MGYVHLDLDVLDSETGRANSLPVPGGISVGQLSGALGVIRQRVPIAAAGLASHAPEFDSGGRVRVAGFAALDALLTEA